MEWKSGLKKKTCSRSYNTLILICVCAIVFLGGRTIPYATGVSALNDVFAYWGLGAEAAGKDWSSLLGTVEYYACGYSFLLTPLFWTGLNATHMFQVALFFNAIMLVGIFFITLNCLKLLYTNISDDLQVITAFVITVYSNNLIQAQETWTEIPLCFMGWLLFYLIIKLSRKASIIVCAEIGLVSGYMYIIHMRALAILFAVLLIMLLCKYTNYISWKQLMTFLATLMLMMIIQFLLMNWTKLHISTNNAVVSANTYSGQMEKIWVLFTSAKYFFSFISASVGKIFYLITSTLMLVLVGTYELLKIFNNECITSLKKKQKVNELFLPYIYLFIMFVSIFGISCIAISGIEGRLDLVVYGRYIESFIGPVIMIGLVTLIIGSVKLIHVKVYIFITLVSSLITNYALVYVQNHGGKEFNWPCCTVWERIYEVYGKVPYFSVFLFALCSLIFVICWKLSVSIQERILIGNKIKIKGKQSIFFISPSWTIVIIIGCIWIWCAGGTTQFMIWQESNGESVESTMEIFRNAEDFPENIYLVVSDHDIAVQSLVRLKYTGAKFLQSRLPDTSIKIITYDEFKGMEFEPDTIFLTVSGTTSTKLSKEYYCMVKTKRYDVFSSIDSRWTKALTTGEAKEVQFSDMSISDQSKFNKRLNKESILTNAYKNEQSMGGYSVYGPYVSLEPGTYEVTFEMELLGGDLFQDEGTLLYGWCDIAAAQGQEILALRKLTPQLIEKNNNEKITLRFSTDGNALGDVEFRVYTGAKVKLKILNISYQKVSNEFQVLRKNTEDMKSLMNLLELCTANTSITIFESSVNCKILVTDELSAAIGSEKYKIQVRDVSQNMQVNDGIVLIPVKDFETLIPMLTSYSIVLRLENYAVLLRNDSILLSNYKEQGGFVFNRDEWVSIRYYTNSKKYFPNNVSVILPEGTYKVFYDIEFNGAIFENNGFVHMGIGDEWSSIVIGKDLLQDNRYRKLQTISLDYDTEVNFVLATRGEVQVGTIDVLVKLIE